MNKGAEALVYLPSPYLILALLAPCFGILIWYAFRYRKQRIADERTSPLDVIGQGVPIAWLIFIGPVSVGPRWWPWLVAGGALISGYALYRFREVRRQLCGAFQIVFGIGTGMGELVVVLTNRRGDPKADTAVVALLFAFSICASGFNNWYEGKKKVRETRPR